MHFEKYQDEFERHEGLNEKFNLVLNIDLPKIKQLNFVNQSALEKKVRIRFVPLYL